MECRVCKENKDIEFMVKHKTDRICKDCNKVYRKSNYVYITRPHSDKDGYKICCKCNIEFNYSNFNKTKGGKGGVSSICKSCHSLNSKNSFDPEKHKQYVNDNRDIINKRARERDKHKCATDPEYRIKKNLRIRTWEVIVKNAKSTRNGKIEDLIGCSVQEYRLYIEQQWSPKMNWDNHGDYWEIDHILPLDSFDLTIDKNQKLAFNYKNVQPLTVFENRSKKNKILN